MAMGFGLVIAILLLKYKPTYMVTVSGEQVGYIENVTEFEDRIQNEIIEMEGKNIDFVTIENMPSYEMKLVDRTQDTNEDEILVALQNNATIMYKYYAIILNDEVLSYVDNMDEAEAAVNQIEEEHKDDSIQLELQIATNYTENIEEIGIETVQVAQEQVEEKVEALIEEDEKTKMPVVNGVLLAVTPVSGRITSRFAEISNIRSGAHTGTDIACSIGTPIKAVADGTVTFAARNGSYGNLVKISHGSGVETWYAHCSKIYATVGQKIEAGDVIAAVGATGNVTGPHLHLEIRINGVAVNPQKYLYK